MPTLIRTIGGVKIYSEKNAYIYIGGMSVDADGDELAYAPEGEGLAPLDYIANAGKPGNWWGISTDQSGQPYIQQPYHRGPGYYVSCTALENPAFPKSNPDRYIDSSQIPYFVLPSNFTSGIPSPMTPPKLGDLGLAYNTQTGDNNAMIYADIGPKDKIGEGSMALASTLALSPNPKTGGTSKKIICYWFVPGSSKGWQPVDTWWPSALDLFRAWGGMAYLKTVIGQIS
jgi:hypothetical protein